jgi:hypothetical protein
LALASWWCWRTWCRAPRTLISRGRRGASFGCLFPSACLKLVWFAKRRPGCELHAHALLVAVLVCLCTLRSCSPLSHSATLQIALFRLQHSQRRLRSKRRRWLDGPHRVRDHVPLAVPRRRPPGRDALLCQAWYCCCWSPRQLSALAPRAGEQFTVTAMVRAVQGNLQVESVMRA